MLKSILGTLLLALFLIMGYPNQAPAITLNIIDGQLHGAFDVDVNGSLYDVEFIEGRGTGLTLTFNTYTAATAASTALLNQIFTQDPTHKQFDDDPEMTWGVVHNQEGWLYTPWKYESDYVFISVAVNAALGQMDRLGSGGSGKTVHAFLTTAYNPKAVWAMWTESVPAPVPEPATIFLLGVGLLGIAGVSRRRIRQS